MDKEEQNKTNNNFLTKFMDAFKQINFGKEVAKQQN